MLAGGIRRSAMAEQLATGSKRRHRLAAKQVSMSDVARVAGVSLITVSRALRRPEQVTQETRRAVQAAMTELGYVPNLIAGGLAATETRIVSVIVPYIAHGVFADAVQGVGDVLEGAGYCVLLGKTGGTPEGEEAVLRVLLGHRPAGVVIQGANHTEATRIMLERASVPVVEIGTLPRKPIDSVVGFSNLAAARRMTQHLIARGYRRIGLMSAPPEHNDRAAARVRGFKDALRKGGLAFDPSLVVHTVFSLEEGRKAAAFFLDRPDPPDAVFCGSDLWAVGLIAECRRRGIAVPGQLGVAGFNDQEIAAQTDPGVTTVRVPRYEIGRRAGELILARLKGRHSAPAVVDLGFDLMLRSST